MPLQHGNIGRWLAQGEWYAHGWAHPQWCRCLKCAPQHHVDCKCEPCKGLRDQIKDLLSKPRVYVEDWTDPKPRYIWRQVIECWELHGQPGSPHTNYPQFLPRPGTAMWWAASCFKRVKPHA